MSRIQWELEDRRYEEGLDRGVLYLKDGTTVPWNGLTDLKETPANTIGAAVYIDGVKRYHQRDAPNFSAALSAFTYPDEFERCDGVLEINPGLQVSNQHREEFDLSYRTRHTAAGYKIHLIYNAIAAPSSRSWHTENADTEPSVFDWDISTKPIVSENGVITAHVYIDTLEAWPTVISALEDVLYGTDTTPGRMPTIEELLEIFENNALFVVIDNGDGSWTATGPDEFIHMIDSTSFEITSPSAVWVDADTYTLSSY
jgi:hypothetical protein